MLQLRSITISSPYNDQVKHPGTRFQNLRELFKLQNWQHLTVQERDKLRQLILHDPLFILNDKELGLIKGPPAHIKIENPHPSRGPVYRCTEKAKKKKKKNISDMLDDIEDRH